MVRTRSKSRGRGKRSKSSETKDRTRGHSESPRRGSKRLKSVVVEVNAVSPDSDNEQVATTSRTVRTRSSSRERRPKVCTVCVDCDGKHDPEVSVRDESRPAQSETARPSINSQVLEDDNEELLDYEDDIPESPECGEIESSPGNDNTDNTDNDDDDGNQEVSSPDQGLERSPEEQSDCNNNARTVSEVRASAKYIRKRRSENTTEGPKSKAPTRGIEQRADNQSDMEASVQTVLTNPEALARVMKECAPVFAKAMQEAAISTAQLDKPHSAQPASPMVAVERTQVGRSGELSDYMNRLELRPNQNGAINSSCPNPTLSEATIYTRACEQMTPPDDQLSPEDSGNSDESLVIAPENNHDDVIAGKPSETGTTAMSRPATSFDPEAETRKRARARADAVVKEAENAKTTLLKPPGEPHLDSINETNTAAMDDDKISRAFKIDQKHDRITARVNRELIARIGLGQYINLQRLLPKNRVDPNDDHDKFRMVTKDSYSYFVDDKEMSNKEDGLPVNSIARWDQAFRVYSAIYLKANPSKVAELADYTQSIHKYAATYPWQRVYNYDILFRQLVEKDPSRPWDIVHYAYFMDQFGENVNLTQAVRSQGAGPSGFNSPAGNQGGFVLNKKDCCFRFNKSGKCKWGSNCKWEHKCYLCGLSNHGYNTCKFRKGKGKGAAGGHSSN